MYSSGLQLPKVSFSEIDYNSIPGGSFFIGFNIDNSGKLSKIDKNGTITVIEGAGGSSGLITVTKLELDDLIISDSLSVGSFYYITGVDSALYGGTDIILQAISENEISEDGIGFFYNPKYSDYQIYNPYVIVNITNTTGELAFNEPFTSNNGTKGTIVGNCVSGNKAYLLTTDLAGIASSISILGGDSGETADITIFDVPNYALADKVIWGGSVWSNSTGNFGTILDLYNLSGAWAKIAFGTTDYNYVADAIKYDYVNDLIIYRREEESNNSVYTTYINNLIFTYQYTSYPANPIKAFQWGNPYDIGINKGNISNKVENSYFECINFNTKYISFNQIDRLSVIYNVQTVGTTLNNINIPSFNNNIISNGCLIKDFIIIDDAQFIGNQLYNSELETITTQRYGIRTNTINSSSFGNILCFYTDIRNNLLFGGSIINNINSIGGTINGNTLDSCIISNNTLGQSSSINQNNLLQDSSISDNTLLVNGQIVYNNLSQNSTISNNTLSAASIYYNKLVNSSINNNSASGDSSITSNLLSLGSNINLNTLDGCQINSNILDSYSQINNNIISDVFANENSLLISSSIDSNIFTANGNISMKQNTLSNNCTISNSTLTGNNIIDNNRLEDNSYIEFTGTNGSNISQNTLIRSSYISESVIPQQIVITVNIIETESYIRYNYYSNGGQINTNTICNNSKIFGNILDGGAILLCRALNGSIIRENEIGTGSSISYCSLDISTLVSFLILTNTTLQYYILQNSTINNWDLSAITGTSTPCNFINVVVNNLLNFTTQAVYMGMPEFTDNAAALAGGVPIGGLYRVTATGTVQIVI